MSSVGPLELLFIGITCVIGLIIPAAILAFLYVINTKLTRIEQLLERKENVP